MGISLNGLTPAGTYPGLIKTGDNTAISGTPKVLSDGNGNNLPMEVSTTGVNFTNQLQQGGVAVPTASQVAAKQDTLVSGTNIKTINGASLLGSGNIPVVTSPSGVAGAIQFSNGSAFASDAANLFWDDTNNRLGVGTNAPTSPFTLIGASQFGNAVGSGSIETFDGFYSMSFGKSTSIYNPNNNHTRIFMQSSQTFVDNTSGNFQFRSAGTTVMNLQSGNLAVGNGSDSILARTHIKGSGSTSATTSLLVQNSAGTTLMSIADNGAISIGAGNITTLSGTVANYTGPIQAVHFVNASSPFQFGIASVYGITGTTPVVTSGQRDGFLGQFTFAPTSGTAILNVINASPTINQTGGANGITRALYINPTLTAAADFRAIEVSIGGAYINTTSVQASAILQADSTTKGFLPPRMTTTQKNAIATPAAGLVVYDSTTNKLCCYNGSTWNDLF
jgi:hypothetical protein